MKEKVIDLRTIERQSKAVQIACTESLRLAVVAIGFAREVTASVEAMGRELFQESAPVELREWCDVYAKVAGLRFAENITETDPAIIREAVELLEIIP
jgi:hypothetical protein